MHWLYMKLVPSLVQILLPLPLPIQDFLPKCIVSHLLSYRTLRWWACTFTKTQQCHLMHTVLTNLSHTYITPPPWREGADPAFVASG